MRSSLDVITPDRDATLPALFQERVTRTPDHTAYRYCDRATGTWHGISWQQMAARIALWRTALAAEELTAGDRVALMLPNSPEWVCFDQAAMSLGLIVVPLYVNDRPENVAYILSDTQTQLFFCQGGTCLDHLQPVLAQLPAIRRIIVVDGETIHRNDPRVRAIADWLPSAAGDTPPSDVSGETTATIVYTSGTTGPPKGVMLSHRNMVANAYAGACSTKLYLEDSFLSFLPLSHMLERTAGYYLPMLTGSTVAFARSIPELAEDLLTIRPTILIAVPRIFEKIHAGINQQLAQKPAPVQKLFAAAVAAGWHAFEYGQGRANWSAVLLAKPVLDVLVARKIRAKLGGRLRVIISGGAPLSYEIAKLFIGLGLPIYQGYGLTETSPVISVNLETNNNPAGVGLPLKGVEVKIGEAGELLVRGSNVMQGYWNRPEATADTIDTEGWLHTGDKAVIENGHIRITGRIKEVIVLSNGEKVAPAEVEMAIGADPLFEQCMLIGEGRPYLSLLAVLAKDRWHALAEEIGVPPEAASLQKEEVHQAIHKRLDHLLKDFPGYVFVKKASLTLEPWTIEGGLLTPTMKIRRKSILERMQQEIDTLYQS